METEEIQKRIRIRNAMKHEALKQENQQLQYNIPDSNVYHVLQEISMNPTLTIQRQHTTVEQLKMLSFQISQAENNDMTYVNNV